MNREQLIRRLRKFARKNGQFFEVDKSRGDGSHYRVQIGERWTTVQSKLKPHKIETILKQLGVDPSEL